MTVHAATLAVLLLAAPTLAVAAAGHAVSHKALRVSSTVEGVVQPLKFKQQLLVCNAYPSDSTVAVKQNGKVVLGEGNEGGLPFQDCRYVSSDVHSKDKLDFVFEGSGIQGTFEVEELPESDALLLLVVERRDATSPLAAFKSLAFPVRADGRDAQLALMDCFRGNSSSPSLRMEDHGTQVQSTDKDHNRRQEQLSFDRIYAVQEGSYDASILDSASKNQDHLTKFSTRMLSLAKNQNYVILRTGDDKHFPQSLMVFPNPSMQSGSPRAAVLPFAAVFAVLAAFTSMLL